MEVNELVGEDGDDGRVVQLLELLEGEEVDVVCGVDGLRHTKDVVGDGEAAAEFRRVLDVVDEERRLVEHADCLGDDLEAVRGHLEEGVEGINELGAEVFAGVGGDVVEGGADYFFLVVGPGALGREVEVFVFIAPGVQRLRGLMGVHDDAGDWCCGKSCRIRVRLRVRGRVRGRVRR